VRSKRDVSPSSSKNSVGTAEYAWDSGKLRADSLFWAGVDAGSGGWLAIYARDQQTEATTCASSAVEMRFAS